MNSYMSTVLHLQSVVFSSSHAARFGGYLLIFEVSVGFGS